MLPKKNRANKKAIEKIFKEGKFVSGTFLNFRFILSQNKTHTQISFIVPKNIAKLAVKRNLLRRHGYLALERQGAALLGGLLGSFIFKKSEVDVPTLENEIKTILHKIN
jgi:ribonuclease P protein component